MFYPFQVNIQALHFLTSQKCFKIYLRELPKFTKSCKAYFLKRYLLLYNDFTISKMQLKTTDRIAGKKKYTSRLKENQTSKANPNWEHLVWFTYLRVIKAPLRTGNWNSWNRGGMLARKEMLRWFNQNKQKQRRKIRLAFHFQKRGSLKRKQ